MLMTLALLLQEEAAEAAAPAAHSGGTSTRTVLLALKEFIEIRQG